MPIQRDVANGSVNSLPSFRRLILRRCRRRSHASLRSPMLVLARRIERAFTGIAFGWIGSTTAFRKP
jgi:hypothetical protein